MFAEAPPTSWFLGGVLGSGCGGGTVSSSAVGQPSAAWFLLHLINPAEPLWKRRSVMGAVANPPALAAAPERREALKTLGVPERVVRAPIQLTAEMRLGGSARGLELPTLHPMQLFVYLQ